MPDRAGQRLDDYRLIRRLGVGSFGEVYLAEHIYRQQTVAVKILPRLAENDLASFLNEARTMRLRHPNIVQVQDFGVDDHVPFIVMDYAPHGTLRQRHSRGSRVPLDVIISYVKQIAAALQYAHDERLIHRDVKPENLLLGQNDQVLVSDFGIATVARSSHSQSMLRTAGTVAYMAPEQVQGKPRIASDQYALGVIVYEWLCGERPFNGSPIEVATQHMLAALPPLHEKIPEISPDVEQVVMTALAKDPNDRFPSVMAFATALEQTYREHLRRKSQPTASTLQPDAFSATPPPLYQPRPQPPASPAYPVPSPSRVSSPPSMKISLPSSSLSANSTNYRSVSASNTPVHTNVLEKIRQQRSRLFIPTAATSALLLIVLILGGSYYYWLRGSSAQEVDASLTQASALVSQAKAEINTNPSNALQKLNQAQSRLVKVQTQNNALSDAQRNQVTYLQSDLTTTTKQAILAYDKQSLILPLPCRNTTQVTSINSASINIQASSLVAVRNGQQKVLYVLGEDHNVYQLNDQNGLSTKIILPATAQPLTIVGDDTRLLVLASLPAQNNNPASYALYVVLPNGKQASSNVGIDPTLTGEVSTPLLMAASGSQIYVALTSQSASTSVVILNYTLSGDTFKNPPLKTQMAISAQLVSMAALKNTQLFFLLANGNIMSQQFAAGSLTPVSVLLEPQPPVVPALSANPQDFQPLTPVPVPAAGQGFSSSLATLSVPRATQLVAGLLNNVSHLYIMDDQYHRVLDLVQNDTTTQTLTATATPTKGGAASAMRMHLFQQYASPVLLAKVMSLEVDPAGAQLYLLTQGTDTNAPIQLVTVDTHQSDAVTCTNA